jgi:glycosyltransferase involved in cell wall biosynthesis
MVSLIVATRGRVAELDRLLHSLNKQSATDFEVIVVDQNDDDDLSDLIAQHGRLSIKHYRCPTGASHARNLGLQVARGDLIAFPDDDCWYPGDVIERVTGWFADNPEFDGLFGILRDAENRPTGPKWPVESCLATALSLWRYGITPVAFLRRRATDAIGFFDENIGPGAKSDYLSGEDADYFLRAVNRGLKLWHDPGLTIHHPSFHDENRLREKSYTYGLGGGYILRVYGFPRRLFLEMVVRSLGGATLSLLRGRPARCMAYVKRTFGLLRGYIWGSSEVKPRSQ